MIVAAGLLAEQDPAYDQLGFLFLRELVLGVRVRVDWKRGELAVVLLVLKGRYVVATGVSPWTEEMTA